MASGLAAALGLNRALGRLRTVFRVGYYLPVVTSIVAIAVIWRFLLDPDFGLVNGLLKQVGVTGPNWLGSPALAMPCIIVIGVWRNLGNTMVLFLAGLQGIPEDVYEAARIDGATPWREFWRVTLPLLRPTVLFVAVITSIGYLQVFEEPLVMTQGGPLNRTLSVSMYLYQEGFNFFHLGYASSIGYTLFVVIAAVTALQFRLLRSG
jgi:multiple sugar transport system permease protein/raffinose/stachyose/melibiose transport system permease protein